MQWQDEYKSKLVDIDTAVSRIASGNDVIVAQCASEPQGCMSRFHIVADRVEGVRVFSVLTLKPYDFYMRPEMKGHFELASWFHAPGSREALKAGTGTVTYVPNMLHRAAADGSMRTAPTCSSARARRRTSTGTSPCPSASPMRRTSSRRRERWCWR